MDLLWPSCSRGQNLKANVFRCWQFWLKSDVSSCSISLGLFLSIIFFSKGKGKLKGELRGLVWHARFSIPVSDTEMLKPKGCWVITECIRFLYLSHAEGSDSGKDRKMGVGGKAAKEPEPITEAEVWMRKVVSSFWLLLFLLLFFFLFAANSMAFLSIS